MEENKTEMQKKVIDEAKNQLESSIDTNLIENISTQLFLNSSLHTDYLVISGNLTQVSDNWFDDTFDLKIAYRKSNGLLYAKYAVDLSVFE